MFNFNSLQDKFVHKMALPTLTRTFVTVKSHLYIRLSRILCTSSWSRKTIFDFRPRRQAGRLQATQATKENRFCGRLADFYTKKSF